MGFNLQNYEEVKDRLPRFYEKFTDGRIVTEIKKLSDDYKTVIIEAKIYANKEDQEKGLPLANGIAFEVETQKGVNATSHIENCETSAIGRALANMNFIKGQTRPSREEMEKVQRMQEQKALEEKAKSKIKEVYKKSQLEKKEIDAVFSKYKELWGSLDIWSEKAFVFFAEECKVDKKELSFYDVSESFAKG